MQPACRGQQHAFTLNEGPGAPTLHVMGIAESTQVPEQQEMCLLILEQFLED